MRRRNPNLARTGCGWNEDVYLPSQLSEQHKQPHSEQQIQMIAREFTEWQGRRGVKTCRGTCKQVKLFVLYLARGGYYHQLSRAEGLSLTATAVYLHQVAEFFADMASR